jgi:type II secretory pathway predicted ATPase ExeA
MNYLEHFGLQAEPFLNVPSTKTFYKSATHGRALLKLMTLADGDSCVVRLVGVPGVGKSLLLRRVLDSLSEEANRVAFVPVGGQTIDAATLASILGQQLRLSGDLASLEQVDAGCARHAKAGLRTVVIIDDADRLPLPLRKALSALSNAVVILAGRPDAVYPAGPEIALAPLNEEGTEGYLRLRLKLAGRSQDIFSPESRQSIHKLSSGIPGRINVLCEQALLTAMLAGRERIEPDIMERAGILAAAFVPSAIEAASQAEGSKAMAAPQSEDKLAGSQSPASEEEDEDDILAQLASEEAAEDDDTDAPIDEPASSASSFEADFAAGDGAASAEADERDNDLDDLLGELEAERDSDKASSPKDTSPTEVDDGLGDLLDDLAAGDESAEEPFGEVAPSEPAATAVDDSPLDDDDGLGDLLGSLDDEPVEEPAPAAPQADDEDEFNGFLGEMEDAEAKVEPAGKLAPAAPEADDEDEFNGFLGEMEDAEESAQASSAVPEGPDDDEIDDLLSDLVTGTDEDPSLQTSGAEAGDDLDDLLSGMSDEAEEPVGSASAESESFALGDLDDGLDESLDGLLDGMSDSPVAEEQDELDDLLSGLGDEPSSSGDDDLDDLLSGMVEEDAPAPKVAAKAVAMAAAPAGDDDLESLLDSLDEAPGAAAKDELESELDSLLDDLDD